MVFSSAIFLFVFLPVIFLLHILIRPIRGKNALLIAASLIFYAFGEPVYVFLMIESALMNYFYGMALKKTEGKNGFRKGILVIAVVTNIGVLGVFKYLSFALMNINRLFHMDITVPGIVLPIGISFFTFQALSYVIDVYRDVSRCQKNFFKVLLYICFFPQLIAGPIIRWSDMEAQLSSRKCQSDRIISGIQRFVTGLCKKLIVANAVGIVADDVFALEPANYSFLVAWLGALCYAIQIYYDFSGYSDMAIGLAKMFGFRFKENFEYPYSSGSIREFWRRWHISLSSWFREYVYIPLGGNRKGKIRTECNKMIVFLLTGFWHGANWTFVLWGIFHGVGNVLEDTILPIHKCRVKLAGNIYTWIFAATAFVMFRADTATQGFQMIKAMFTNFFVDSGSLSFLREKCSGYFLFMLIAALVFCYPVFPWGIRQLKKILKKHANILYGIRYAGILAAYIVCVCSLAASSYNPFIYFRF